MRHPSPSGVLLLIKSRVVAVLLYSTGIASNMVALAGLKINMATLMIGTVIAFLATISSYILSDLMDLKEDMLNSPNRPLPSGKAKKEDAVFLIITGVVASSATAFKLFGPVPFALVLLSFILGSSYSLPGIRGKSQFWSKATLSALGGFVGSFTGASILGLYTIYALDIATINGLLIMLLVMIGDIIDYDGDKATGVRSLAVVFGRETALKVMKITVIVLMALALLAFKLRYPAVNPAYLVITFGASAFTFVSFGRLAKKGFERHEAKHVKQVLRAFYFIVQTANVLSAIII